MPLSLVFRGKRSIFAHGNDSVSANPIKERVEHLFGISRYRAQHLLDKLLDGPTAKFYRERFGTSYVYRRFGT